jgi:hypothetical protein
MHAPSAVPTPRIRNAPRRSRASNSTYGAPQNDTSAGYQQTVVTDPFMQDWLAAAAAESAIIEASEIGR